jgi:hypothetical protein
MDRLLTVQVLDKQYKPWRQNIMAVVPHCISATDNINEYAVLNIEVSHAGQLPRGQVPA